MPFAFDTDTQIARVDESTWTTRLDPKWSINVVPNGGYSSASMIRAMLEATEREHPLSVTTHFYKACEHDAEATVTAQTLRAGSRFAHATATLSQDGRERSSTVAILGSLPEPDGDGDGDGKDATAPLPIDVPPPEECFERDPEEFGAQGFPLPIADMLEMRIDRRMGSGDRAHFGGWIRFRDGRPNDALSLTMFADALPPAQLIVDPKIGWVPTLELTVHVRRRPVGGWIRAAVTADDVQGKLLVEDVLLWDETDALVARSRQLAMLLT